MRESSRSPVRGDEVRLEVPRDTFYLASIRSLVAAVARHGGFDERATRQIVLAVDEACAVATANREDRSFDPGSGEVQRIPRANKLSLTLRTDARRLEVRVIDHGRVRLDWGALEQTSARDPSGAPGEAGLGLLIISSFMDEVELAESPAGSELILTRFRRRGSARQRTLRDAGHDAGRSGGRRDGD